MGGVLFLGLALWCSPGLAQDEEPQRQKTFEPYQGDTEPEVEPESASTTHLDLALRSGGAFAFGDTREGLSQADIVNTQIPIWIDVGARFGRKLEWHVGLYASYGFTSIAKPLQDLCDADEAQFPGLDTTCSARDLRVGFQFQRHYRPTPQHDFWFGVGFGWEWLTLSERVTLEQESATLDVGLNGLDLSLQLGLDIFPIKNLGIGPFLALDDAYYFSQSQECTGSCGTVPAVATTISGVTAHYWLFLGARVVVIL
ncbi:MAG TPA: hypothetical protein VGK73_36420 [Polyangiaceae bacterium]